MVEGHIVNTGVVYLLGHPQLAARLVVSVFSLRKWYDGPVTVFTTRSESHEIGRLMKADARLGIEHRMAEEIPADNPYASAYLTKVAFLRDSPYDATVFIDADTLIVGPIDELVQRAASCPLVVTIYGHLTTTDPIVEDLWPAWRKALAGSPRRRGWAELVERVSHNPWLLVNAGVFAVQRDADLIDTWLELTLLGRETRTPEETALQLMLLQFPHHLLGCRFNCLPQVHAHVDDLRILHFAGASHLNEASCQKWWLPAYQECVLGGVANLAEWSRVNFRAEISASPKPADLC